MKLTVLLALLSVVGCHDGRAPASTPSDPSTSKSNERGSDPSSCGDPSWTNTYVSAAGGGPQALVRHPANWKVSSVEPGRTQFDPPKQPFQMIVSTLAGMSLSGEETRILDLRSLRQLPIVSPWTELASAGDHHVFTVTHATPSGVLTMRYHVGTGGLVLASIETTSLPLSQKLEPFLDCVHVSFSNRGAATAETQPVWRETPFFSQREAKIDHVFARQASFRLARSSS
jgi:hypothetical protein